MAEPLIINNFQTGIADSPHLGFGVMKNVEIGSFPGSVKTQNAPASLFVTSYSSLFTASVATDRCIQSSGTVPATGTAVKLTTTGTLPAGLTANTVYYIIKPGSPADEFMLASNLTNAEASTQIDITDTGTGNHTVTSINPGTINHIIADQVGTIYMQDSNGRVWFLESNIALLLFNSVLDNAVVGSASLTNASGNGMITFRTSSASATYLLAFRNGLIDIINVTSTANKKTPSWTNGWNFGGASSDTSLETAAGTSNSHHAILGQDNIIYFCDDRYIGSIKENSGSVFNPADTATYTGNNQALDLPTGEISQWLDELGTDLLIAGNTYNKIYPWNRLDDSFKLPLSVPEIGVSKIKNIGNLVYILAGSKGNVYTTQGTYVTFFKKVPEHISNNSGTLVANPITWGGIWSVNGNLLFGMSGQTSGNSGVFMLTPDGVLTLDNQPSTGSGLVKSIYGTSDFYKMGYASGADYMTGTRYASYNGVVHSALYRVSTKTEKATYSTVEVQLAQPASSAHVRVSYRTDTSSSFTTIDTYSGDGATTSFKTDAGLTNIENIQIQLEMDGNIEVMEVRLLP